MNELIILTLLLTVHEHTDFKENLEHRSRIVATLAL